MAAFGSFGDASPELGYYRNSQADGFLEVAGVKVLPQYALTAHRWPQPWWDV